MFFYGKLHQHKQTLRNLRQYNLRKLYRRSWMSPEYLSTQPKLYAFIVPFRWDFMLLQKPSTKEYFFYTYSSTYFFQFPIPQNTLMLTLNMSLRTVSFYYLGSTSYRFYYWKLLRSIFQIFHHPFFLKIKFKGKGYYIYKNHRQTITPQFGYAHRLYLYSYYVSVLFLSKTQVIMFGLIHSDLVRSAKTLKQMRSINIFTGRGVRFAKQVIYRKVGKVSSYR